MTQAMVPTEEDEYQNIRQWSAAQWEESSTSLRTLREPIDAVDLERCSIENKRPTSSQISGIWNAEASDRNPNYHKSLVKLELISWDGPDDPANPMNWPVRKRAGILSVLAVLTLLSIAASSMFSPALIQVAEEFQVSSEAVASFAVTVYLLGFGIGAIFMGPLSERYGRLPIYHGTNVFFVAFTIGCAKSNNMAALTASRFFAGCVGCTPLILGNPTIGDFTPPEKRGPIITLFSLFALLGPVVGPIGGGFLSGAHGWRWVFGLIAIVGGVTTIAGFFLLHETYAPVLLERKVARLRKETGNIYIRSEYTKTSSQYILLLLLRPIKFLVFSPIVLFLALHMAIAFSYLYLLLTTVPVVFQVTYDFSPSTVGLVFLGLGVGMVIGFVFCLYLIPKYIASKKAAGAAYTPESLLPLMIPGAFFIPISLFWYGWSIDRNAPYIVPIVANGFLGASFLSNFVPIQVYLVEAFTIYSASAIAATTIFRCIIAAFLPMGGASMFKALGLGWGSSVLGFVSLAMLPVPFVFLKYGAWLREKYPVRL